MKVKIITKEQASFLISADLESVTVYATQLTDPGEEFDAVYRVDDLDAYSMFIMVEKDYLLPVGHRVD